jgi:hypothetical protein
MRMQMWHFARLSGDLMSCIDDRKLAILDQRFANGVSMYVEAGQERNPEDGR